MGWKLAWWCAGGWHACTHPQPRLTVTYAKLSAGERGDLQLHEAVPGWASVTHEGSRQVHTSQHGAEVPLIPGLTARPVEVSFPPSSHPPWDPGLDSPALGSRLWFLLGRHCQQGLESQGPQLLDTAPYLLCCLASHKLPIDGCSEKRAREPGAQESLSPGLKLGDRE